MGGTDMAVLRWAKEPEFYEKRVIRGTTLDIGPGVVPLAKFAPQFSQATHYTALDHQQHDHISGEHILGDAVEAASALYPRQFDCVYSSHSLEHMPDPTRALRVWWSLVKPGGHLMVIVPSWLHYERLIWPPHCNSDHRYAWVMHLPDGGKPLPFIRGLINEVGALPGATIQRAMTLDKGFRPGSDDQTADSTCESAFEIVAQKAEEV